MSRTAIIGLTMNIVVQALFLSLFIGFGRIMSAAILFVLYVGIDLFLIWGFRRSRRWYLAQIAELDRMFAHLRPDEDGPEAA